MQSKIFVRKLNAMIKDEKKAPRDYAKLKALAKTPEEKKVIAGIIKQEKQHYVKLIKVRRKK
jgi:rubrerythrin